MFEMQPDLILEIRDAQSLDPILSRFRAQVEAQSTTSFHLDELGTLWFGSRLCVPSSGDFRDRILSEAHDSGYSIHPGEVKMYQDLKKFYWWPGMKKDVTQHVAKCLVCQQVKADRKKSPGLLNPLSRPMSKFESITMDFVTGFPKTRQGYEGVWVIVDRLSKMARFIPFKYQTSADQLGQLFLQYWHRSFGCPVEIISDRDPRFTSKFWESFHKAMGTKLRFSTAHHPQTDEQSERTIQTLEDMLRSCALSFGGSWADHLPLAEFAYNNSYHSSIGMAPFEAIYGIPCRTPLWWGPRGSFVPSGPELVSDSADKTRLVLDRLRAAQDRQKKYADVHRRPLEFMVGEHVMLRVSPTRGVQRFGVKGKLSPRYIGPFEILERVGPVAYRLALPPSLDQVHPVFHVSQLRRYIRDPSHVIDFSDLRVEPNVTYEESPFRILDSRVIRLRSRTIRQVLVQWRFHSECEATWESEDEMRQRYPELFIYRGMFSFCGQNVS